MPSSINSTSSSPGGIVTTGAVDNALSIQTGDTTAVSIDSSQVVTFNNPIVVGTNAINAENSLSFRNRLINSDMRIDQRGVASVNSSGGGTYGVDRWKSFGNGGGVFSAERNTDVPNSTFQYSTKLTVTTADVSIAASDYYAFNQDIEGFNAADLGFGTADAKTVTLSFWVRSSITGTYAVALYNSAGTRGYPATYSISAADTWTFVSLTIPGDTGGTWLKDNGVGITIRYDLGTGSDGNGTANTWNTSGTFAASRTSSTVNWIATNGATFYLTGVQLEVGSVATPFERRPYGTELSLCQRYYWQAQQNASTLNGGIGNAIATGTTTYARAQVPLPVTMRAVPTVTATNVQLYNPASGGGISLTFGSNYSTTNMVSFDGSAGSTTSPSGGSLLVYLNGSSAVFSAAAEL